MADCPCANTMDILTKFAEQLTTCIEAGDPDYPAGASGPQVVCKGGKRPIAQHRSLQAVLATQQAVAAGVSAGIDPANCKLKFANDDGSTSPSFSNADPKFVDTLSGKVSPANEAFSIMKDFNLYKHITLDHIVQICLAFKMPNDAEVKSLEQRFPEIFNIWSSTKPESPQDVVSYLHKTDPYLVYKALDAASAALRTLTTMKTQSAKIAELLDLLTTLYHKHSTSIRSSAVVASASSSASASATASSDMSPTGVAAGSSSGSADSASGAGMAAGDPSAVTASSAGHPATSGIVHSTDPVLNKIFVVTAEALDFSFKSQIEDTIASILRLLGVPLSMNGSHVFHPILKAYREDRASGQPIPLLKRDPRAPTAPPEVVGCGDWVMPHLQKAAQSSAEAWKSRVLSDRRDPGQILATPVTIGDHPSHFTDFESMKIQFAFWNAMQYRSSAWSSFAKRNLAFFHSQFDDYYAAKIGNGDNLAMWNILMRHHTQVRAALQMSSVAGVKRVAADDLNDDHPKRVDSAAGAATNKAEKICIKCAKSFTPRRTMFKVCPACFAKQMARGDGA